MSDVTSYDMLTWISTGSTSRATLTDMTKNQVSREVRAERTYTVLAILSAVATVAMFWYA